MILKCDVCRKEIPRDAEPHKDFKLFTVPEYTCAVVRAKYLWDRPIIMCKECYEKHGRPIKVYMGNIEFEKDYIDIYEELRKCER